MVSVQTGGAWVNGWCRRFFKWVGERERLFIDGMGGMGAEMGSSIVMYNLGVGPWGTL